MRSVGTLIFERPRPLSRQRRANHLYTLICEEPEMLWQPPVSTFNSHDITRLDDEQRGR